MQSSGPGRAGGTLQTGRRIRMQAHRRRVYTEFCIFISNYTINYSRQNNLKNDQLKNLIFEYSCEIQWTEITYV